jgi:hypothetical protein
MFQTRFSLLEGIAADDFKKYADSLTHAGTREDPAPRVSDVVYLAKKALIDHKDGERRLAVFREAVSHLRPALPKLGGYVRNITVSQPAIDSFVAKSVELGQTALREIAERKSEGAAAVTQDKPRSIPINVDIFADAVKACPEDPDIVKRLLEILAMKQLYLNRRAKTIGFEFVSHSGNQELLERIEDIYNKLEIVKDRHLKLHKDNGFARGFTITSLEDEAAGKPSDRCVFLRGRIEACEKDSGLYMWIGVLDLAIALTMLLGYSEEARRPHYPRLAELYNKMLSVEYIATEAYLKDLLSDDITLSLSIARKLAIDPITRFNIDDLRSAYIRMKELAHAA